MSIYSELRTGSFKLSQSKVNYLLIDITYLNM